MDWAEIYMRLTRDANDAPAFQALQERVRPWAWREFGDRGWAVVEDIVEDTSAEVIVNLDQAHGPDTFRGFVVGHYLNARRHVIRQFRVPTIPIDPVDPSAPDDDEDGPNERHLAILRVCLNELPDRQRRAVKLRYFKEATDEEISRALHVTPVNARQLVFRGLARLRRCVRCIVENP